MKRTGAPAPGSPCVTLITLVTPPRSEAVAVQDCDGFALSAAGGGAAGVQP
ncbi:hypothetical protein LMG27952_02042 [Paraburkholderia hiiakae]|uniref:Uncharacterized protein n=1 Tax=Paraburkholderia hiiakae TaxID=1081782 RepID=A0ABM8NIG2_9BURK|nr:hypothetical protein LMG27952_02042 [Paraburkholderia hiiakae]